MKQTSSEWSKLFSEYFHISDREGWGKNIHYAWFEEQVELNEFIVRAMGSTCFFKKDWKDIQLYINQVKERHS